ncbi:alcohol oxidase [Polyplosphaeria fusca]|uniref:Alcohol oxidase n=1 Tax=Polyplosphaeria fusca TaxID=682080 RepID=A0A9P4V5S7_9PLEO|nr:alcohol oxidase [Polyplosphaeria fusca]
MIFELSRLLFAAAALHTFLIPLANGSPALANQAQLKRSVFELDKSYDYVIIGGGTAGLTVANRLSEDANRTVLVVEIGYFGDESCIWMPKFSTTAAPPCSQYRFNITAIPQTQINDSGSPYRIGAVVGGSSAVNGMVFDRAAKEDYDIWERLGNHGWGWDGLYPYFIKSAKLGVPRNEIVERYGYTYDETAYGDEKSPIWASFPPFQWNTTKIAWQAWEEMGVPHVKEHALGDAVGRFWVPASQHPINQTRSYARYGYYDPIATRTNYHLLIGHKAEKLVLSANNSVEGVIIHHRDDQNEKFTVKATKETILSAGAIHSPQILELSGIGSKDVLEAAGIEQKVDLPGVGANFQDHPQVKLTCNFTNDTWPNPSTLINNSTFAAAALAEYNANKTGPYTLALNTAFSFLSLRTLHPSFQTITTRLRTQFPSDYLPASTPSTVVTGYGAQLSMLASHLSSSSVPAYEAPIGASCPLTQVILHPLSRGTVHIDPRNATAEPRIDFRTFANPLDVDVAMQFVRYTRGLYRTAAYAERGPVETGPGANVTDEDVQGLERWVRGSTGPTSYHACGTTSMLARELGGVVDTELRVYGVGRLSVVDAGIMPLIVGGHLSASVYAIAEKAADLIKARA